MTPEYFKGDPEELKFDAAGGPIFEQTSIAKDQMLEGGYEASSFLLMLYDEARVPFTERIKRSAFVEFYREALKRFPTMGTFDAYIFVLRAIFGQLSQISFLVPNPGVLYIDINTDTTLEFDFIGRDADGNIFDMVDFEESILTFRGLAGIETAYELELMFSEITPAGISTHISLSFYERFDFVAEDAFGDLDNVVDHLNNQIVFQEIG